MFTLMQKNDVVLYNNIIGCFLEKKRQKAQKKPDFARQNRVNYV